MKKALITLALVWTGTANAQDLYWGSGTDLFGADVGSGVPSILAVGAAPHSAAVWNGHIYWSDLQTNAIRRTELGGAGGTSLFLSTAPMCPVGIAIDPIGQTVYWTEGDLFDPTSRRICRANLTGVPMPSVLLSNSLATPLVDPIGIQVDHTSGRIFWADYNGSRIGHATLSGAVVPGDSDHVLYDLVDPMGLMDGDPEGVAYDSVGDRIYWGDANVAGIRYGPANGAGPIETLATAAVYGTGAVALDVAGRKLYFDSQVPPFIGPLDYEVRCFHLPTGSDTIVLSGLAELNGTLAFCGSPAGESVVLGSPPNPNALLPGATSKPVLGGTWDPSIDHSTFFPAASLDFLLTAVAPQINVPTAFGTLLCNVPPASQIYVSLAGAPFVVPIPDDCRFLGLPICAQGVSASFQPLTLELTNGLALVLGTY